MSTYNLYKKARTAGGDAWLRFRPRPALPASAMGTTALVPSHWVMPLAYLSVYLGWGTTYLAIRVGVQSFGPATFLGLRFIIAALVLFPILILKRGLLTIEPNQVLHSAIQGILLLVGGLLPVAIAEKHLPSNITAIIIGCAPIAFAAFDRLLNGTPIRRQVFVGFVFGFVGILLLSIGDVSSAPFHVVDPSSLALVVLGSLTWAFASVFSKKLSPAPHPLAHVFIQYVAAGMILMVIAFVLEGFGPSALATCSLESWMSLAYISLIPSLISYMSYMWLIKNEPSSRVSTYAFVNPVVAVIAGALVLNEPANLVIIIALALVLLGTWFTFLKTWGAQKYRR